MSDVTGSPLSMGERVIAPSVSADASRGTAPDQRKVVVGALESSQPRAESRSRPGTTEAETKLNAWEAATGGVWGFAWNAGRKGGDIACLRYLDGQLIDRSYAHSFESAADAAAAKLSEVPSQ